MLGYAFYKSTYYIESLPSFHSSYIHKLACVAFYLHNTLQDSPNFYDAAFLIEIPAKRQPNLKTYRNEFYSRWFVEVVISTHLIMHGSIWVLFVSTTSNWLDKKSLKGNMSDKLYGSKSPKVYF